MAGASNVGWSRRFGLCWAFLSALVILVGLSAPGPAAARPSVEYNAPGPVAQRGAAVLASFVTVQDVGAAGHRAAPNCAPAAIIPANDDGAVRSRGPPHDELDAHHLREAVPCRPYEATGPPTGDL